jgi:glycosyltransferase involved in cell wall biosynthesis
MPTLASKAHPNQPALLLSLVVPVYNEEECIKRFMDEVSNELTPHGIHYEIVFIDDGSKDLTVPIICEAMASQPKVKLVELAFNHGKQAAVTAGIEHASGDLIIYMDPDLQDPPSEIIRFVRKLDEGYDLVFGVREERHADLISKLGSLSFWWVLDRFTGLKLPRPLAVMRGFNRAFANEFMRFREANRFIEGIFATAGLRQTHILIPQRPRFAGVSKFNFRRRLTLALNAILDYSDLPLRLGIRLGLLLTTIGLIYAVALIIAKLSGATYQMGWPSMACMILIMGGMQLFCIGLIGAYLGKIYLESKHRPLYSVRARHGLNRPPDR